MHQVTCLTSNRACAKTPFSWVPGSETIVVHFQFRSDSTLKTPESDITLISQFLFVWCLILNIQSDRTEQKQKVGLSRGGRKHGLCSWLDPHSIADSCPDKLCDYGKKAWPI